MGLTLAEPKWKIVGKNCVDYVRWMAAQKRYRDSHREEIKIRSTKNNHTRQAIAARARYAENNVEGIRKRRSAYKATPEGKLTNRKYILKKKYGITLDQYNEMLEKQGGLCANCGQTNEGRILCVDHNHKTGAVRELLCNICNWLEGTVEKYGEALVTSILSYRQKHG